MEDEASEDGHDGVDGDPVLVVDGEEVHDGRDVAADDPDHVDPEPGDQEVGGVVPDTSYTKVVTHKQQTETNNFT